VASTVFSEHPSAWTPLQGTKYTARGLDALAANSEVGARYGWPTLTKATDCPPQPVSPARDPSDPTRAISSPTTAPDDEYHSRLLQPPDAQYRDRPHGLGPGMPF
jgi:hypothetical protein